MDHGLVAHPTEPGDRDGQVADVGAAQVAQRGAEPEDPGQRPGLVDRDVLEDLGHEVGHLVGIGAHLGVQALLHQGAQHRLLALDAVQVPRRAARSAGRRSAEGLLPPFEGGARPRSR